MDEINFEEAHVFKYLKEIWLQLSQNILNEKSYLSFKHFKAQLNSGDLLKQ